MYFWHTDGPMAMTNGLPIHDKKRNKKQNSVRSGSGTTVVKGLVMERMRLCGEF